MRFFPTLLLSVSIILSAYLMSSSVKYFKEFDRTFKVMGLDERVVKSNHAQWILNLDVTANTLKDLYTEMKEAETKVTSFLTSRGFDLKEIEKLNSNVTDQKSNYYGQGKFQGERYSGKFLIVVNTEKVDAIVDASKNMEEILSLGIVVSNSQVNFEFDDINGIKPEMVKSATEKGRSAAKSFATDSKLKIGSLKNATQGVMSISNTHAGNYQIQSTLYKKVRVVVHLEYFVE